MSVHIRSFALTGRSPQQDHVYKSQPCLSHVRCDMLIEAAYMRRWPVGTWVCYICLALLCKRENVLHLICNAHLAYIPWRAIHFSRRGIPRLPYKYIPN